MFLNKWILSRRIELALWSGLLVEDDISLVEENFHLLENLRQPIGEFLFTVSFLASSFYVLGWGTSFLVLSAGTVFAFELWHLVQLWVFQWVLSSWLGLDQNFQQFIGQIRQKEIITFRWQSNLSTNIACAKVPRLNCLSTLRRLLHDISAISKQLVQSSSDRETLIENFANEDLLKLSSLDSDTTDDQLQLSSLKALWQYLFLIRSELLRLYLFMLMDYYSISSSGKSSNPMVVLFRISCATFPTRFIRFDAGPIRRERKEDRVQRFTQAPGDYLTCVAQLEFTLERLYEGQRIPPDLTSMISALKSTLEILEKSKESPPEATSQASLQTNRIRDENSNEREIIDEPAMDESKQTDLQYEVFEVIASDDDPRHESNLDEDLDFFKFPNKVEMRSVVDELKVALKSRKFECQMKEREALARFRKVPVEEIQPEEEITDERGERGSMNEESPIQQKEEQLDSFVPTTKMGRPTAEDLQAILRKRLIKVEEKVISNESDED